MARSEKYYEDLERRNAKLRLKFEKEAHDREAAEIRELIKGYEDWKFELNQKNQAIR
jgi:hypothetical protein